MQNPDILETIEHLGGDVDGFYCVPPLVQTAIAAWILEDRTKSPQQRGKIIARMRREKVNTTRRRDE